MKTEISHTNTGRRSGPSKARTCFFGITVFFAVASAAMLSGCDNGRKTEITTNLTLAVEASVNEFLPVTTGTAGEHGGVAGFSDGDKIGITILSGGNAVRGNIQYEYASGKWSAASTSAPIEYEAGMEYLAYYPYDAEMHGMKSVADITAAFSPKRNQEQAGDYRASDLLVWRGPASVSGDQARLKIEFKHAMSLVVVFPKTDESHSSITDVNVSVTADGLLYRTFGAGDGTWHAVVPGGSAATASVSYTYEGQPYSWNSEASPFVTVAGRFSKAFYNEDPDPAVLFPDVTINGFSPAEGTTATVSGGVTSFSGGELIGVIGISNGSVTQNNIAYEYTSGGWVPADGNAQAEYDEDTAYIVYYPYGAAMSGKRSEAEIMAAFSPAANQSVQSAHFSSDLMMWSGAAAMNGGQGSLNVSFNHALALVAVVPQKDAGHTGLSGVSVTVITDGVEYRAAERGGATWEAIVPPGNLTVVKVSYTCGGETFSWDNSSNPFTTSAGEYSVAQYTYTPSPEGYYALAVGKAGETLRSTLHSIISDHSTQSYASLWTHFRSTDVRSDGKVWDMYSDVPGGTPPYIYTFGDDQCGNYSGEGSCYNREHSFPKSWFKEASPMYSDLFHLYPTDGYVNGRRSNYPFGEVNSASWTSRNGSKVGSNSYPGYSGTVFEPIDEYKGDFARTYFYMVTCYMDRQLNSGEGSNAITYSGGKSDLKTWAVNMFIEWHESDPVSKKETDRNSAVYDIQGNRNPYIDHPELVDHIWGDKKTQPFQPN